MRTEEITLTSQDPTIFVKCDKCCSTIINGAYGNYYGASFTKQQWRQGQTCPNCKGELTIIRKIKVGR